MTVYQRMRRPRNADPNTAFTQVSEDHSDRADVNRKVRVSLDPNNLLDDGWDAESKVAVLGSVLFSYENHPDGHLYFNRSCRSFNASECRILTHGSAEEQGRFLEQKSK